MIATPHAKEIFLTALEIVAPADRQAYLDVACGGDAALRRHVEELLKHQAALGSFLQAPAAGPMTTNDQQMNDQQMTEGPGTVIGPYQLLEQIGEGGFGVVFMAEQSEPVRRKVALKILKPGMDTRQVVARFEAERQALAIMDHPNIAKVFDGGSTESSRHTPGAVASDGPRSVPAALGGRPYFVMELVKGMPITDFCDRGHLTPRQRLELFLPVCQAVQHAHHKGIIHRDLKPSNVLVAVHDSKPVPKIIDFGIAKALGQELTDKTVLTGFAQMIGTPLYMSPEQAGQNSQDIDTRSDIYSLGVLLYELLTGTTPFTKERFKQAAYDEIRRIIREEDPPKPSTRLSDLRSRPTPRAVAGSGPSSDGTRSVPATLAAISAQRRTEPAKLTKLVRGELDWIIMKALEKDRDRRYETADGFAQDLQRYLADEPVEACPPSVGYRLRKFVRRNRGPVLTAALVLLALVGGIVGTSWGLVAAEQARKDESEQRGIAVAEAAKAKNEAQKTKEALEAAHKQLLRAEWLLYASQIRLAQQAWEHNNAVLAKHYLDSCRPDFRGWEYDYLIALFSANRTFARHTDAITSLLLTPDGKQLITSSFDRTIKMWDLASGEAIKTLQGHTATVYGLAISADGKRLLSSSDQTLRVWDLATGTTAVMLNGKKLPGSWVLSRDGKRLVNASGDGTVRVWNLDTGEELLALKGHSLGMLTLALLPDDNRLLVGTADGPIKIWDAVTGAELGALKGHTKPVTCLAVSSDGQRVVSGSLDQTVKIWDMTTGKEVRTVRGSRSSIRSVAVSSDGKHVAGGCADSAVIVWDASTGEMIQTFRGHTAGVTGLAFLPDGSRIVSGSYDHTVKLWNMASRQEFKLASNPMSNLALTGDGKRIVCGTYVPGPNNPVVRAWDAATGKLLLTLNGHTKMIQSVAVSGDGGRIVSGDLDGVIKVWDRAKNYEPMTLAPPHTLGFLALSPDGRRIAGGGNHLTVRVWDADTGREIAVLKGHPASTAIFLPGDKRLVTAGGEDTVKIWDMDSGEKVRTLTLVGHRGMIHNLAALPDGKLIVSGSDKNRTVKIWNALTGAQIAALKGHTAPVTSVAVLPDGKRIVTSGPDAVRLWDAATGYETLTLKGGASKLAVSPDGRRIFSSTGNSIDVWDASPNQDDPAQTPKVARLEEGEDIRPLSSR
jgi:WD40 repeat protein/serine/threonine protein kinase